MPLEDLWPPVVVDELNKTPEVVRRSAYLFVKDVCAGVPEVAWPLERHDDVGDLSDCHKIYVDETPNDLAWRVVVKFFPSTERPAKLVVVAVGPREGMQVYKTAAKRLGRLPDNPETRSIGEPEGNESS